MDFKQEAKVVMQMVTREEWRAIHSKNSGNMIPSDVKPEEVEQNVISSALRESFERGLNGHSQA